MNDNHFQMQSALDGNYINIVLQESWRPDQTAIRVIKENCPDFLLPFGMTNINDEVILKYKAPNAVSLKYLNGSFTKQMFLDFYEGLLEPFVKGYDWFLDYHYICVIPDYVYVNKRTVKSSFLYIPEQSYQNTDEEIINFLKNALNKVMITDDSAFLVQLYQYFNAGNVVISELENMIKTEKNKTAPIVKAVSEPSVQKPAVNTAPNPEPHKPIVNPEPKSTVRQPMTHTAPASQPSPSPNVSETSDNDVMNALFGSPSKKKEKPPKAKKQQGKQDKEEKGLFGGGLFGKKKPKTSEEKMTAAPMPTPTQAPPPIMPEAAPAAPIPNIEAEDVNATTIDELLYQAERCLELIESQKVGAIARISLDFPNDFITIGRESQDAVQPDIRFDKSFKQISRMHLRIERKGDSYYAIDLGSGNHTLIDGQMMAPNTQYKLNAGTILSLAANMPVKYRVNI